MRNNEVLQRILFVPLSQQGSHWEGGEPWGFFIFFFFFDAPPPPAVLASIFYREKGSAVPSLVETTSNLCQLTKLFSVSSTCVKLGEAFQGIRQICKGTLLFQQSFILCAMTSIFVRYLVLPSDF